jgi:hypothetical protein
MKDEAFCNNCGAQANDWTFPSALIFTCAICQVPFCISVRWDYSKETHDPCATVVHCVGDKLEWTEVAEDMIVSVILYKNYLPVPLLFLNSVSLKTL